MCKEAVYESNLIGEEQAEAQAQNAGCGAEVPVKKTEADAE